MKCLRDENKKSEISYDLPACLPVVMRLVAIKQQSVEWEVMKQ
jgi:hypothetical protein